jgi:hypothetical protein
MPPVQNRFAVLAVSSQTLELSEIRKIFKQLNYNHSESAHSLQGLTL